MIRLGVGHTLSDSRQLVAVTVDAHPWLWLISHVQGVDYWHETCSSTTV